jgi:hypothetical protein
MLSYGIRSNHHFKLFLNNFICANTLRSGAISLYQQIRKKEVHHEIQPVKQIKKPDR